MAINVLGMQTIDDASLDALAEAAAARKGWEFLFTVAPLLIPGAPARPSIRLPHSDGGPGRRN